MKNYMYKKKQYFEGLGHIISWSLQRFKNKTYLVIQQKQCLKIF